VRTSRGLPRRTDRPGSFLGPLLLDLSRMNSAETSWESQSDEGSEAFEALRLYRDLRPAEASKRWVDSWVKGSNPHGRASEVISDLEALTGRKFSRLDWRRRRESTSAAGSRPLDRQTL
jgi:hypothetical protein